MKGLKYRLALPDRPWRFRKLAASGAGRSYRAVSGPQVRISITGRYGEEQFRVSAGSVEGETIYSGLVWPVLAKVGKAPIPEISLAGRPVSISFSDDGDAWSLVCGSERWQLASEGMWTVRLRSSSDAHDSVLIRQKRGISVDRFSESTLVLGWLLALLEVPATFHRRPLVRFINLMRHPIRMGIGLR